MSEATKIQWATHTFNPWEGCTKVSPGCAHCYAETRNHRFGGDNWGKGKPRRRTSPATWRNPIKWNGGTGLRPVPDGVTPSDHQERPRVFPSLCDPFDDEVAIEWLYDFLRIIDYTPNLDWLLLTKRPQNIINLTQGLRGRAYRIPSNVWLGVSVEDQQRADERIPELLKIPARLRFLSVEPLLGPVTFCECSFSLNSGPEFECEQCGKRRLMVDWVIVGGESGPKARPCNVDWIRSLVHQCAVSGVACFVKQLGRKPYAEEISKDGRGLNSIPLAFRDPKGGDPAEWPEDLRIRQFPFSPHPSPHSRPSRETLSRAR